MQRLVKRVKAITVVVAFLLITVGLNAQTTYYVVASGGSDSNTGADSTSHAWATIAHAMSAASSGDIVWICAGKYTISSQLTIPAGVNVRGSGSGGVATVLTSSSFGTEGNYMISMTSSSMNSTGQTISYLKFDGNSEAVAQCFFIQKRNNVKMHHCNFVNFKFQAVVWSGDGTGNVGTDPYTNPTAPTSYVTGSEFYNNKLTNCSAYDSYGHGALCVGGQEGMLIHDNVISNTSHTYGDPGYCIKMQYPGFMKGCKVYNNTLTTTDNYYLFAIEGFFWYGMEIYNNTIIGAIDVNFISKGAYEYGAWIHNNILGPNSASSSYSGIIFEFNTSDVIVEKNTIKYCANGIMFTPRTNNVVKNYRISYNLFQNAPSGAYYTRGGTDAGTFTFRNIKYYNNVFDGGAQWGLSLFGTWRNFSFVNNVMTATSYYPIGLRGSAADTVIVKNNNFYNCAYSTPYFATAASNYSNSGNITSNPNYSTAGSDFSLKSTSPNIDAGVSVGLTDDYLSNSIVNLPDIGAYEYNSGTPAVPVYKSASVENATPTKINMTYSATLASVIPATSAFTVMVNSTARTVSSVAVSGTQVQLTLASAVVYGDVVTVAYTKPSSDFLQTSSGGEAASLSTTTVTNNVAAIPVFSSASIANATPSRLDMTYNLSLASVVPAASAFTVTVNSTARTVSSVAVSGTQVQLTLASAVVYGDVVTVAYTKPSSNYLQTSAGGQAASLSTTSVTNNVSLPVPVFSGASIANATPSRLDMTYSLSLASVVPATSAFTVMVNSAARTVSSVAVSGTQVQLTLASAVAYGDVVTVAYIKPSSNYLQTAAGGQAASLSSTSVTNNVGATVPAFVSALVSNATPGRVDMTYSLSLANVVPAVSAFTVMVNSTARTVSSVAVSGTQVQLTLASAIVYGDVVTVAYTKPASNYLQTAAGGQAASLGATSVANNVATAVPAFVSAVVSNSTPGRVDMTYNLSLASVVPAASAFTVIVNSAARTVSSVAVSGTQVQLTLASAVAYGDVVTVAYTKPASNYLQTVAGGQAASLTARSVTNNVNPPVPVFVRADIYSATPDRVDMTYSLSLANTAPDLSTFKVTVNAVPATISSVSVSDTKVYLTLANKVYYGDIVKVSYTKPSVNGLQSTAGALVASMDPCDVTNNSLESDKNKNTTQAVISIYPNPATTYFNVELQESYPVNTTLRVFDITGKVCLTTILEPDTYNYTINFKLRSGLYLVQITKGRTILYAHKLLVSAK
jgi:uncharacterized repeat protein (TIGR02059 family)